MIAALSVRGLVAGYDGVPVVRDLDLDVGPDTFLAMVGANGAGKTTTLRAIMGLCDVLAGTVDLGDRALADARTSARVLAGLALCPEGRQVFPSLTVEENLLTGAIAGQDTMVCRTRRANGSRTPDVPEETLRGTERRTCRGATPGPGP